MQPHEIVILCLSIGTLVSGLIWMLWSNLKTVWPKGQLIDIRCPGKSRSYLVHVYIDKKVSPEIDRKAFARSAARAVWASASAWMSAAAVNRVMKDDSEVHETIVFLASSDAMDAKAKAWGFKNLAGYIDRWKTQKWGGDMLPMAVISERNAVEVGKTGEPVIHEMMHALERDYVGGADDHSNPVVWMAAASRENIETASVQESARKFFATPTA